MNVDKRVVSVISEIKSKLDTIENYMMWLIKPDLRFKIGQRVEWSRRARRCIVPKTKFSQRGVIKAIDGFSVRVAMDGLKHPKSYHHAFFNPITGSKLF